MDPLESDLTLNSAAAFEFDTETQFDTASALLAKNNANENGQPGAANGQCFHIRPLDLAITRIF